MNKRKTKTKNGKEFVSFGVERETEMGMLETSLLVLPFLMCKFITNCKHGSKHKIVFNFIF